MKKLVNKSGSTLTYTLIIITVMSILALTVAMMVGFSSKMKFQKYDTLKNTITLENTMAEIVLDTTMYQSAGMYYLNNELHPSPVEDATYRLMVTIDGNTTLLLANLDDNLAVICELSEGLITKWGTTKWNIT